MKMSIPVACLWLAWSATGNACEPLRPEFVRNMVIRIAAEEGLDQSLALAVVDVESNSGAKTLSKAGAVGIMQLMPDTAKDYGVADRCNAALNIRAGIRYLKKLLGDFGDPVLALAAYNAGPGRVLEKGGVPENPETSSYIIKILNRWKYGRQANVNRNAAATPAAVTKVQSIGPGMAKPAHTTWHVLEVNE